LQSGKKNSRSIPRNSRRECGVLFLFPDFQAAAAKNSHPERSETKKLKQTTETSCKASGCGCGQAARLRKSWKEKEPLRPFVTLRPGKVSPAGRRSPSLTKCQTNNN